MTSPNVQETISCIMRLLMLQNYKKFARHPFFANYIFLIMLRHNAYQGYQPWLANNQSLG